MSLILVPLFLLSNCTKFTPEAKIVTQTEYISRTIEVKNAPKSVEMPPVEWFVVSEKNIDEFLERVKVLNGDIAFIAVTPMGYENLALGIGDLRRYILQQKQIIAYYEEAVKAPAETE